MSKLIFIHIEKCGGSSIRLMLFNYFKNFIDINKIYIPEFNKVPNLVNDKNYNKTDLVNYDIFLAHCGYYNDIPKNNNTFQFTILRNPIKRIISHYYYFDYKNNKKHIYDNPNYKNIINNYGKLYLSRFSKNNNIKEAIENIKKLDHIVFLENIDNDLKILNNKLNKIFNKNYIIHNEKQNENKNKNYFNINKKKIEEINKLIIKTPDYLIYKELTKN